LTIRQYLWLFAGWLVTCACQASEPPVFDVNFVVLTQRPEAITRATPEQMRREVDILNTYFIGEDGKNPARFRFKNVIYAHQLLGNVCGSLLEMGDYAREYDPLDFEKRYDACADNRLVDPGAINFYVYDSYSKGNGFGDITSHGDNHADHPFVLIDWERLDHRTQSPEEHEMGHVFGLSHICVPGAKIDTSTNIMASVDCGLGSGGLRNIPFNAEQLNTIRVFATRIAASLGPYAHVPYPLTGLWWNSNESGWGMSITQRDVMIFVAWFTYDPSGAATWYVMSSCPILGNACAGDIYSVTGGKAFTTPWDGTAKVVTKVGSGILSFLNENAGTLSFTINGVQGSKSIVRQMFASGTTPPATDYSDLWWNPNESGWGLSLTHQYGTMFAVMFGYDTTGNPSWYVASNCKVVGNGCSGDLYEVASGTRPTATWSSTSLVMTKVGVIELVFTNANNATMNYFIKGAAGSKQITRELF
jgi:hypothetical protein